ncbi:MAG: phosphate propanoyltransferase [Candidatus Eisenbacteria bacterium]
MKAIKPHSAATGAGRGLRLIEHLDIARLSDEVARRVRERIIPTDFRNRIIVPIGVSGRHIHLTREVLESLFGKGHELSVLRDLSQPGEFAANETVTIVGPGGRAIERVRILGPVRPFTQAELSRSDGLKLGLDLPVRRTCDIAGTPGITLVGPRGTVVLKEGAIRATRHIHMSESDAVRFRLSDGQIVRARSTGPASVIFENVLVRVSDSFVLDFHLDTDDASAAGLDTGSFVEVMP